jgi:hypothetical protein
LKVIDLFALAGPDGLAEDEARGFVSNSVRTPPPLSSTPHPGVVEAPAADGSVRIDPATIAAAIGGLSVESLQRGQNLSARIPDAARRLATQPTTALPLVLALMLDRDPDVAALQYRVIAEHLSPAIARAVESHGPSLSALPAALRLPLAGLAAPALIARPQADRDAIMTALDELARADNRILPFEYALTRLMGSYLADATDPRRRSRPGRATVTSATDAAVTLLAVIAASGNADPRAAEHAFHSAAAHLLPQRSVPFAPPPDPWVALDAVWPVLDRLDGANKKVLVESLVIAIRDDGVVTVVEAELLRAACAMVHCPVPALIG